MNQGGVPYFEGGTSAKPADPLVYGFFIFHLAGRRRRLADKTEKAEIQVWENSEFGKVRSVMENKEPWFIAKDVAQILGYRNASDMARCLDDDEKLIRTICVSGQGRKTTVITESGLYHAIFMSRKEDAKSFRRWVTEEVLPQIRRAGSFGRQPVEILSDAVAALSDRVSALEQKSVGVAEGSDSRTRLVELVKKVAAEGKYSEKEAWYALYSGYSRLTGIPLFKCAKATGMSVISFIGIIRRTDSLLQFAEQLFWFVA